MKDKMRNIYMYVNTLLLLIANTVITHANTIENIKNTSLVYKDINTIIEKMNTFLFIGLVVGISVIVIIYMMGSSDNEETQSYNKLIGRIKGMVVSVIIIFMTPNLMMFILNVFTKSTEKGDTAESLMKLINVIFI